MYVDNNIICKFKKISIAFKDQPIRRLISEDDKGGYLISNVATSQAPFSGGFYEEYCVERMEININDET